MSKDTKAGKLCIMGGSGGGDTFGELARTSVLLGIASDEWLIFEARLKIFILFEA